MPVKVFGTVCGEVEVVSGSRGRRCRCCYQGDVLFLRGPAGSNLCVWGGESHTF